LLVPIALSSCLATTGDRQLLKEEVFQTPLASLPEVQPFPLRLSEESRQYLEAAGERDILAFLTRCFPEDLRYPPADIRTQRPFGQELAVKVTLASAPITKAKQEGVAYATLRVMDWNDPTLALFRCEGEAHVVSVTKTASSSEFSTVLNNFGDTCLQNSIADMIRRLNEPQQRDALAQLAHDYEAWQEARGGAAEALGASGLRREAAAPAHHVPSAVTDIASVSADAVAVSDEAVAVGGETATFPAAFLGEWQEVKTASRLIVKEDSLVWERAPDKTAVYSVEACRVLNDGVKVTFSAQEVSGVDFATGEAAMRDIDAALYLEQGMLIMSVRPSGAEPADANPLRASTAQSMAYERPGVSYHPGNMPVTPGGVPTSTMPTLPKSKMPPNGPTNYQVPQPYNNPSALPRTPNISVPSNPIYSPTRAFNPPLVPPPPRMPTIRVP